MRALRLVEPRRVEIEDVPRPEPGTGQVRIRVEGCGVCGSNVPAFEGRSWFEYPFAPGAVGHEGWGTIDAVGRGVDDSELGSRVAFLSERAFAEYDLADVDVVVALPPRLEGAAVPGEALGCAVNVFRRSAIAADQRVAVVGIGFLGAAVTALAAAAGADVVAVSRRPYALDVARRLGARATHELGDVESTRRAMTADGDFDVVVECVGRQEALDLASRLPRVRGRLVIAGFHQDGPRSVDMQAWNWRGLDVINAHERERAVVIAGVQGAVESVIAGALPLDVLVTHAFPLDRANEAFVAAIERPDGFLKAVVTT